MLADLDEVADGPGCLLNALAPDVFRGETNRYGRAGRIPGSVNVFAKHLLDDAGRLRPEDELREQLDAVGALGGGRVVAYCGAGVSATLDAFALTLLGETDVAIYDGSMSEWILTRTDRSNAADRVLAGNLQVPGKSPGTFPRHEAIRGAVDAGDDVERSRARGRSPEPRRLHFEPARSHHQP